MKIRNPFSVILVSVVLAAASARAAGGHKHGANCNHGQSEKRVKFQTHCPVTGRRARRDCFADQHGQRVYFCSATCSQEFGKDPGKYIGKLREQGVTVAKVQTTCPVTGKAIDRSTYVDIARLRIYLCSADCADTLRKTPGKYVKQQMMEGVTFDSPPCDDPRHTH